MFWAEGMASARSEGQGKVFWTRGTNPTQNGIVRQGRGQGRRITEVEHLFMCMLSLRGPGFEMFPVTSQVGHRAPAGTRWPPGQRCLFQKETVIVALTELPILDDSSGRIENRVDKEAQVAGIPVPVQVYLSVSYLILV